MDSEKTNQWYDISAMGLVLTDHALSSIYDCGEHGIVRQICYAMGITHQSIGYLYNNRLEVHDAFRDPNKKGTLVIGPLYFLFDEEGKSFEITYKNEKKILCDELPIIVRSSFREAFIVDETVKYFNGERDTMPEMSEYSWNLS